MPAPSKLQPVICAALVAVALLASPALLAAAPSAEVRLGRHSFDWTTVENDRALFAWSAEVVNDTRDSVVVQVFVDLLDDDDAVVKTDSVELTLAAGEIQTARHDSSMSFDAAAGVVSFRFRLQPRPTF